MTACRAAGSPLRVRHNGPMSICSPYVIVLSEEEDEVLLARARSVRSEYRDRLRARVVLAAAAGQANAAIARRWACARTRSAHGVPGSPSSDYPASPTPRAVAAHRCSPRWIGPRSSRWRARCRPRPGCRCRGGVARNWPVNWRSAARSRPRCPRSAAGWPRTPSSRGSTGRGSSRGTPTSWSRPPACWFCTPGSGTANPWAGQADTVGGQLHRHQHRAGHRRRHRRGAGLVDLSHEPPDDPLPAAVAAGKEPLLVLGAMAGG